MEDYDKNCLLELMKDTDDLNEPKIQRYNSCDNPHPNISQNQQNPAKNWKLSKRKVAREESPKIVSKTEVKKSRPQLVLEFMKESFEDGYQTNMPFEQVIDVKIGKGSPKNFTEYWKLSILEDLLAKATQRLD